jgi:hypothetical protein
MPKMILEIRTDAKGAITDIKSLGQSVDKFGVSTEKTGSAVKGMWKQFLGGQIAMEAVSGGLRFIKNELVSMVSSASDAIETEAMFGEVFKEETSKATSWVNTFSEAVGRNRYDVMQWAASFQDTFVPLGFARDTARGFSQEIVKLGVDLSSFKNIPVADVMRDMQSALVGNHETVRKYGVIITEAALKQEVLRMGIQKSWKEVSNQEKVQARMNLIMKSTVDAQGDAIRTADSHANVMRSLKSTYEEFKVEIGKAMIDVLLPIMRDVKKWFNENKEAIQDFAKSVVGALADIIKFLIDWKDIIVDLIKIRAGLWAVSKIKPYIASIKAVVAAQKAGVVGALKYATMMKVSFVPAIAAAVAVGLALKKGLKDLIKVQDAQIKASYGQVDANQKMFDKFRAFRDYAKIPASEMRALSAQYRDNETGIINYNRMMLAFHQNKHGDKLKDLYDKWNKGIWENTERVKKANKALTGSEGGGAGTGGHVGAVARVVKEIKELTFEYETIDEAIKENKEIVEIMTGTVGGLVDATFQWTDSEIKAREELEKIKKLTNDTLPKLADFFWTLKDIGGILGSVSEGLAHLSAGFADIGKGILAGGLAGATGIIGGLITAVQGLKSLGLEFSFKEDSGIGQMINRVESVKELFKQYSAEGFKWSLEFAQQVQEAMSAGGAGQSILEKMFSENALQTVSLGFTELITKAKEFGMEGGRVVIETMQEMEAQGIRLAEVEAYKNEQLNLGLEAYKKMREAVGQNQAAFDVFSDVSIGVYDDMLEYQALVAENQDFLNALQGYTDAWIHFSNVTELNQEQFDQFKSKAIEAYDQLTAQGFTSQQALSEIAPMLQRLKMLQQDFGLQVDDTTAGLIDQADQKGLLAELNDPMDVMVQTLQEIVDIMKSAFPAAAKTMDDSVKYHFKQAQDAAGDFGDAVRSSMNDMRYTGGKNGKPVEGYATGTHGWETMPSESIVGEGGPELIRRRGSMWNVTPIQTMPQSGSVTKTNTIAPVMHIYPRSDDLRGIATEVFRYMEDNLESMMDRIDARVDRRVDKRLGEA